MFSKGILGAIPFVGPLAAEIVGSTIPNQRIDRLERLLYLLEEKIENEDKEKIQDRLKSPEYVDLMEDSFVQTSRALSDERKDYIASLLKNSLTSSQVKHMEYKKLLSILEDLNDIEVVLLKSYSMRQYDQEYREFLDKHKDVLEHKPATYHSTQEEIDSYSVFLTYKSHLTDLGLLKKRFKKPKKGQLPEFDEKTGMVKVQGHSLTNLGRLLLKSIDQLKE